MTDEERALVQRAFFQGPSALIDEGLSPEAVRAFMDRADVQAEYELLQREFQIHEPLSARAKFVATRNLHRMIDPASAILGMALAGPEYARDAHGNILRDGAGRPILRQAEPTRAQMAAAKMVMEGVGVGDHKVETTPAADANVSTIFSRAREVVLENDPTQESEEERALSRERVRNAIMRLSRRLPEARERAGEALGMDLDETTASRRKRTGKKTASKRAAKRRTTGQTGPRKKKTAKRRGETSGS